MSFLFKKGILFALWFFWLNRTHLGSSCWDAINPNINNHKQFMELLFKPGPHLWGDLLKFIFTQSIWQCWQDLWWLLLEIIVKCLLHFFSPFHTFLPNSRYPTLTSQQSDEPCLHHKCSGTERKDIFFFVRKEGWWWVLALIFASTYKYNWFPGLFVSMKLKELLKLG